MDQAAAFLQSTVKNYPFVEGNKRLGWLATAALLALNGTAITGAGNDDVYDLVMGVAAGSPLVDPDRRRSLPSSSTSDPRR